jgi:hypothetical protein
MFCCFILILSSGLPVDAGPQDPVNIPDAGLRGVIEGLLSKTSGETITEAEMAGLTSIVPAITPHISELTGLEHAVNLTRLQFIVPFSTPTRPTWSLEPLRGLTKLKYLSFQYAIISDMEPLKNLTELDFLSLSYTSNISVIPDLSKLTKLVHLRLDLNNITNIEGIKDVTSLRQVRLNHNYNLSDISPLESLTDLEILYLNALAITDASLPGVLSSFSEDVDGMNIDESPSHRATSGYLHLDNTNVADLSVLDSLPDVFLLGLYLRFMGNVSSQTVYFHLRDLTPLVDLINKGKVINDKTDIRLDRNLGLDYESLYEDIPILLQNSKSVRYQSPTPTLEKESPTEASYTVVVGSSVTLAVRAINEHDPTSFSSNYLTTQRPDGYNNRQFAKVPVIWRMTRPGDMVLPNTISSVRNTISTVPILTGDDGLSSLTPTLSEVGEYTFEAIVPENTRPAAEGPSHPELKVTFTVTTVLPNRPPAFKSASAVNVSENTTAVVTVAAEDPNAEDAITGYTITGGADQALFEIGGTNTPVDMLRFKTAPDFEMPGSAADSNVYTVILTATSGAGDRELTATQTLTVTVTDVDETPPRSNGPPVFLSASSVNVLENTTAVITVVAADPDAGDAITGYRITGGPDQALFEIGGTSSPADMLRFKTAPDFEMPGSAANSNVYTVILTATSGVGDRELMSNQTLTVTVTDVDERPPASVNRPPVFTSASAVNVAENTTAVITVVAADPDADDVITSYTITGGVDAALFQLGGTNTPLDMLRFKVAPDFEMPGSAANSNVYTLILTATSGVGDRELTATQTLTVTVTDVDETPPPVNRPPAFTSASWVSVPENTTAVITVVAEDPDAVDEITGYTITGGADASLFELGGTSSPLDMLRFKAAPDFEAPKDADKNNSIRLSSQQRVVSVTVN